MAQPVFDRGPLVAGLHLIRRHPGMICGTPKSTTRAISNTPRSPAAGASRGPPPAAPDYGSRIIRTLWRAKAEGQQKPILPPCPSPTPCPPVRPAQLMHQPARSAAESRTTCASRGGFSAHTTPGFIHAPRLRTRAAGLSPRPSSTDHETPHSDRTVCHHLEPLCKLVHAGGRI
jgi:hypothetical protein